ncbi:MAG: DUF1289 domain-containing protein [Candidatus Parcubacteria bacterium]|nr:DUF1289 domain-containing protein [Burkholderiales bacterium]
MSSSGTAYFSRMIASPCVKVCVMDAAQRYCTGCLRTLAEIARWGEMSEVERERVMAQLPGRRSEIVEASVPPFA